MLGDRSKRMAGLPGQPASLITRDPDSKKEGGGSKADRKDGFWEMIPTQLPYASVPGLADTQTYTWVHAHIWREMQ